VSFPDLGLSKFLDEKVSHVVMTHPRYTSPESASNKATMTSPVFSLGVIAQELLCGGHPFDKTPDRVPTEDWQEGVERYLPGILSGSPVAVNSDFVARMLDKDPEKRPSIGECADEFKWMLTRGVRIKREGLPKLPQANNTILFPARMGIPHRGHIEYMSRLMDLGGHVAIAISRAYTITSRDPIPKWLVMKMVAQSLLDAGYPKENFDFFLTPFYSTAQEKQMHFKMMPIKGDIIAVASSNPDIHEMFSGEDIIEQKDLFGAEGEKFDPMSWGEILRHAVVSNDKDLFDKYAASGVEKILDRKSVV
jgi:serine/threonine protein kinase